MFIIDDLLLAPISGLKFILTQIHKVADHELNDETFLKEQLLELQMRLELGEVAEDDFKKEEADIFARLREIKGRQLESLTQVHTAQSSSFVITSDDD